ncbi:MAG: copper resistance protein CopC [Actinomycetota bacterium]
MRRLALAALGGIVLAGAWLGLAAEPAGAHAAIVETEPSNGAVLDTAPSQIRLSFTEPPDLALTTIEVLDVGGAPVPTGSVEPVPGSNREIRVPVQDLADGVYTVVWRTVSRTDGHTTSSAFSFGVGVSPEEVSPLGPGTAPETPPPNVASVAGRWGIYAGLAVLFGAAIAGLLAFGVGAVARPWLLGLAWTVAAVGVAVITLEERASVGVPLGTLLSSDTGGKFVRLAVGVVLVGVATLAVSLKPGRVTLLLLAAAAGTAMVARAQGGHAAGSALDVVVQSLHLAGVGAWIGGIAWLVAGLRRGLAAEAIRRFSNLAAGGLLLVVGSGVLRASSELGGPAWFLDPFRTDYRSALVVKIALIVPLVALGAMNRFRNVPRFEALGSRPLLRTVGGELAFAAGVLAVAGVMTGLPPRGTEASEGHGVSEPLVVTGSDFATTTNIRLEITPGVVGPNAFLAEVTDYDTGDPVDARRVTLRFDLPERPEVGSTLELARGDGGTWRADGTSLALHGTWTVRVLVERSSGSVEVRLEVTPHPPEHDVEISRVPGQPDLYTITLRDGLQIQAYVDPGESGRINQVHVTAFDEGGAELPLDSAVVAVAPPGDARFEPELLRLGPGHFAANVEITSGTWSFSVTADAEDGRALSASFEQTFEA